MSKPMIFLSYARKDGEAYAAALRQRLEREHPELTIWQDRTEMEGGVGWWSQIEAALDQVQFLVIVMTPQALISGVMRKVWRYARQLGVNVYPVKGVPDEQLDFAAVPNWMRKAHWFSVGRLDALGGLSAGPEWETFIRHLQSHHERRCVPFMAPDRPEWFVERPREFDQLLSQVLDPQRENPVGITTALQGAGGYGKTTLAGALCHEDRVIEAFDDGILWATLGQTPNLLGELSKLYEALTREPAGFVDATQASIKLAEKLEGRNCLLVLDDVWKRSDVEPFLRGGKGCARLITTRRRDVAGEVRWIKVDEMAPGEAVELLTRRLPTPPADLAPFRALARRLGEWPLLLKLAGGALRAQLGFGATLADALRYVNDALGEEGVTAFDAADGDRRNEAVTRAVGASLQGLKAEEQQRLFELAIFPEDIGVPLTTLGQLWGLNRIKTEQLAQTFANLALFDLDLRHGVVLLHDVMRAYLARRLGDSAGVHGRLLAAWGDVRKLPDAYAWRWIACHLAGARREDELRQRLLDFDWLQAKLEATDVQAFISDFENVEQDEELKLIEGAIRLSARAVGPDNTHLAGQLIGRLSGCTSPAIGNLLEAARNWRGAAWLMPLHPRLRRPPGARQGAVAGYNSVVPAGAVSPDSAGAISDRSFNNLDGWHDLVGTSWRPPHGSERHVRLVAASLDGRQAVSAQGDNTLTVWDSGSGQAVRTLAGHRDPVKALAVSPDGLRVVSGSLDRTLKLWDLGSGQELIRLVGHRGMVEAVAFSPDGRRVVSGADDHKLMVWDLESGQALSTLVGHSGGVSAVAVSADGRRAVSVAGHQTLKVWDLVSGEELRTLALDHASAWSAAVSQDCRRVVSTKSGTLKVWCLESGQELRNATQNFDRANPAAKNPDGRRAVSMPEIQTMKVLEIADGRLLASFRTDLWTTSCALSRDGRSIVAGEGGGRMHFLRLVLPGDPVEVGGTESNPDGSAGEEAP